MKLKLALDQPALSAEDMHSLTVDMCNKIQSETNLQAKLAEGKHVSGQKGDAITLGTITMTLISSGTVVALFEVIKSYFSRDRDLQLTIEHEDGRKLTMSGKNLNQDQFNQILSNAQ